MRMTDAQQFDRLAFVHDWSQDLQGRMMRKFLREPASTSDTELRAKVFTPDQANSFLAVAQRTADNLVLNVLRDGDPALELEVTEAFGFPDVPAWRAYQQANP